MTEANTIKPPLISLDAVLCRLDRDLYFRDINWQLEEGQQWAIVGANGAGKTALAQLISHHLAIASGALRYADSFNPARDIAWVSFEFQQALCERDQHLDMSELSDTAFDVGTTAREAILQGRKPCNRFAQLCQRCGLESRLDSGIRYLSSGEMRKVLIVRALLQAPKLLILDDPLEGLDRHIRRDICALLEDALGGGQQALLLTRRKSDLLEATSHILLLDKLAVVTAGPKASVQASPHWLNLFPPLPVLPPGLPQPDSGRPPFQPPADTPLIDARQLRVSYQGVLVLDNIDLRILTGQHTAISGPNGCGKSTLLNLLCGENHKAYGQKLALFGRRRGSGETLWEVKSRFGIVSNQVQARYIRGWTALEVVISGFYDSIGLYDAYGASEQSAAQEWLDVLLIGQLGEQLFHKLSFGQQRAVLLARAMVSYPPMLVLDEPCTGLDDYHRDWILNMVDHIVANSDSHILFVSHLRDELPSCINHELEFRRRDDDLYQLVVTNNTG